MTGGRVHVSHLEDLKVVLRLFDQVFDGKIHPLSVPVTHTHTHTDIILQYM